MLWERMARQQFYWMVNRIFYDNLWVPYERLPPNVRENVRTVDKTDEERERCWDMRKHLDLYLEDKRLWCVTVNVQISKEEMIRSYTP